MAAPALAPAIDGVIAKMRSNQNAPLAEESRKDYRREVRGALEVVPAGSIDATTAVGQALPAVTVGHCFRGELCAEGYGRFAWSGPSQEVAVLRRL